MLGGGNPVVGGSNPSGTGSSINYIGEHAYAYSGEITSGSGTTKTLLNFITASNSYIVGTIHLVLRPGNDRPNDDIE